jgi:hypothetical protein
MTPTIESTTTTTSDKSNTDDVTETDDVIEAKPCQNIQPLSNHSVENSNEITVSSTTNNVPTSDISKTSSSDVIAPANDVIVSANDVIAPANDPKVSTNDVTVSANDVTKDKPYLFSRRGSGRRLTASTIQSIVPISKNHENDKKESTSTDKNVRIDINNNIKLH